MSENNEILTLLREHNAIVYGHFLYTSGKHGEVYINKDAIYIKPKVVSELCLKMSIMVRDIDFEVVCAPTIGGVILSQWIAYHSSNLKNTEILSVFSEEVNGKRVLKRGYDKVVENKKILVVDDILTTGSSIKKVISAVKDCKGIIQGSVCLVNRGKVNASDIDSPFLSSLLNIDFKSYEPEECPLCKRNIPINTDLGKGKKLQNL
ncbi:MAG: orotate phosphoribosyltransferase [Thermodesulfobium narugense]|nr:MAG: orotate phosphoribosyltransferase [Thermodesulfobium narugense]